MLCRCHTSYGDLLKLYGCLGLLGIRSGWLLADLTLANCPVTCSSTTTLRRSKIEAFVARAIARHILIHRDQRTGGWVIDNLIRAVGAGGDRVAMRRRRRELHACAESLKTVGLVVDADCIYREA